MKALVESWQLSDALFARLGDLRQRPIPLRHPFLFYVGHLPAFAWNQLSGEPLTALDRLFAFGIDPEDPTPEQSWPPLAEVLAYRDSVRERLLALQPPDVHMVVEHERMHHETLLYMAAAAAMPLASEVAAGDGMASETLEVPACEAVLGAPRGSLLFGWDNEFPEHRVAVDRFVIDTLPVRNIDWLRFVEAGGPVPATWSQGEVRSLAGLRPLDEVLGWPVQVSGDQAAAYAAWKGKRLPTEAELAALRGREPPGNTGGARLTPQPVGASGGLELVGNGWEWTSTPFRPFPGFRNDLPGYPGYSANFFDDKHRVVVGGSWITDPLFLRPSFRNWYRSDYPWVFSKFRTVSAR